MQWAMHSSSRSIASEEDKSRPDIISVVMENKATCSSNEWVLVDTPVFGDFFVVYKNWTLDLSKESADDEPEERPAIPEPEERPATLTPEPEERPPTPEPEERPATLTPEPEERPATPEPEERPPTPEPEERPPTPEPEERPPTPKPEERPAIPEPEERPATPAVETVDKFIYRRARENNARLTSEISLIPLRVAVYLFQNNLIGIDQYNYARNNYQEESDKATRLANVIFTCDLSRHFRAVLTAFDEAGVETMTEIAAEARDLYPDAFLPSSDPETLLSQKNRNFKFDEQLEEKIKQVSADGDGGPTAAIGYINELVHPKERELLLHKACHDTTDLNTFNIVLLSTTEAGLINYSDERVNQRTPLHVACACLPDTRDDIKTKQQVSKITDLLKRDAKATLQDIDGNTPLHLAALRNNPQTVSLILTLDPDSRNIANNLGNTALHIASKKNFMEVAQALLTYAHKVNACISNKTKIRTPLHQAVSRGHSMMAGMILDYEPRSVECLDKKGMSPLLLAAKRGHLQIIKRLVKKPLCPVFVIDNEGRTPLHYACAWGNYDLVDFLLKENSSRDFIDHKDNKGETALHIAGRHGDTKVWKLLRSKNASKVVVNDFGETPKEVAASAGHSLSRRRTIKGVSKPIPIPTVSANTYVQLSDESYLDETV